jgi:glutamate synthase (NADPH/NADH) large chain
VEATQSELGERLLENFENEREKFAFIMPRALLQYQDADEILAAKSPKELQEELATALAKDQVANFKQAWRDGKPVLNGAVPNYADPESPEMFGIINSWTVLQYAIKLAMKRLPNATSENDPRVVKTAKNLVLTEDFALMSQLLAHAKSAVSQYNTEELAIMVSAKRIRDFKKALSLRNILSMDSPGTYGWLLHQDRKNAEALGFVPNFERLFASNVIKQIAEAR